MATTGPAMVTGTTVVTSTTTVTGQGNLPIIRALHSTDGISAIEPSWTDRTAQMRSYSVMRGRNTELDEFDAATATIVFDNRDRSLDPNNNAAVQPMNRIWLYEEFSGEVHSLIKGYAISWTQNWPEGGLSDATATVAVSDEFKVLSLDGLPNTSPPRSSYSDLAQSDNPLAFWELNVEPDQNIQSATDTEPNPPDPGRSLGLIPLFGSLGSPHRRP